MIGANLAGCLVDNICDGTEGRTAVELYLRILPQKSFSMQPSSGEATRTATDKLNDNDSAQGASFDMDRPGMNYARERTYLI